MSEYHVASFIAYAYLDVQEEVITKFKAIESCDVHAQDASGHIIVTLESKSQHGIVNGFEQISNVPGVLNVSPVYHEYCDEAIESSGVNNVII